MPTPCLTTSHAEVSWTEGEVADGAVTSAKLAADVATGVTDHGQLSGLADDDHPQYLLASGARALAGNVDAGGNKAAPRPPPARRARRRPAARTAPSA
ncbi:MAG: hypothetical protein HYW52_03615 [Gemmatimonadetes bacterium]|nr:hypothetical protein [Gemmatimonadota bacterium]MBI2614765.1 hypothetical protein [Gemmatimonadota bacterium]